MKRERLLLVSFIALSIGFSACQKESSNSNGTPTLGIQIQALNKSYKLPVSNVGTKSASIVNSSITWDMAEMVVSSVKFEAELKSLVSHRDSIEISYKWTGPQLTDLMDNSVTLGNFVLQPGFYDEIEITVKGLKIDAGDNPVFLLHGTYAKDNTTSVPVTVMVDQDIMFKSEKDSVEVTDVNDPGFTSIIQLYLDQLMLKVQPSALDNATLTDGAIVISAQSNKEIYWIIMSNLVRNHHLEHRHEYHKSYEKHHD